MLRLIKAAALPAALAIAVTSCSGGSSGTSSLPTVPNGPAPSSTAAAATTLSAGDASAHELAAAGGIHATVKLNGGVPASATLTVTPSISAPAGAPTADKVRSTKTGTLAILYYQTYTPSVDLTLGGVPQITLTLPDGISTANRQFFYAISDPTQPGLVFRTEGPASVSGQQLAFPASATPLVLKAGQQYIFAFYAVSSTAPGSLAHVLLISVDGLHQIDLVNYAKAHPSSTMASLLKTGINYTNAFQSAPSDSFPGLLTLVTGALPVDTGVYYDDSYDRSLSPPGSASCSTKGTEVVYDESIDIDPTKIDGGGGIDPAKLPRDPAKGCAPVYPHQFLRVNTIFEVAHGGKLRTAWSDKHLAYELVNGPSGSGVDDLYTPEIAANNANGSPTGSLAAIKTYDTLKVNAIVNEIHGYDHSGSTKAGMPAIFGMNFQAVSVTQKLPSGGYADASGTPAGDLVGGLDFVDQSLGKFVDALTQEKALNSTLIVLTAKHGQAPINRSLLHKIASSQLESVVNGVAAGLAAQITADDVALIWLTDGTRAGDVASALAAQSAALGIDQAFNSWMAPPAGFGSPSDSRPPDVVVRAQLGVIYTGSSKIAEHGGFSDDDRHVALLLSLPSLTPASIAAQVQSTQVAPTILKALGLDPSQLQGVQKEGTPVLPSTGF